MRASRWVRCSRPIGCTMSTWVTWTPYTYPFNITGQPAISIPCGFDPAGLPVGLQVIGPWGHDDRVLDFARLCERALAGVVTARVAPRLASKES